MRKSHTCLYSSNENLWLPIYLPVNGFIICLGFGKVFLSTIIEDSVFVGKGIEDGPPAATSVEDITRLKKTDKRPLKAVDVYRKKVIGKHLVLIECVKDVNPITEKIVYPYLADFPDLEYYLKNFYISNVFSKVNENYEHEKNADFVSDKLVFAWDERCLGYGGPRYNGIGQKSMELITDFLQLNPYLTNYGYLDCLKRSTKKPEHWDDNVWKHYTLIAGSKTKLAGCKAPGQYTVLTQNPPKVPSFIKAPHATTFAEWSTSSCWYKTWCEVYNQDTNDYEDKFVKEKKVKKRTRFSSMGRKKRKKIESCDTVKKVSEDVMDKVKDSRQHEVCFRKLEIQDDRFENNVMDKVKDSQQQEVCFRKLEIQDDRFENQIVYDNERQDMVDQAIEIQNDHPENKADKNKNDSDVDTKQNGFDEQHNRGPADSVKKNDIDEQNIKRPSDSVNECINEVLDEGKTNEPKDKNDFDGQSNKRLNDSVNKCINEVLDEGKTNEPKDKVKDLNEQNIRRPGSSVNKKNNEMVSESNVHEPKVDNPNDYKQDEKCGESSNITEQDITLQTKQAASDVLLAENDLELKDVSSKSVPLKMRIRTSRTLSNDVKSDKTTSVAKVHASTVDAELDIVPPVPECSISAKTKNNDNVKMVHDDAYDSSTQSQLISQVNNSSMKQLSRKLNDGLKHLSSRSKDNVDDNLSDDDSVFQNLEDLVDDGENFTDQDIWKRSLLKKLQSNKTNNEINVVSIMDTDYQEYLMEVDLDDIENPCERMNVKEEYLNETATQLKNGYQPTKGLITVNARKEDIEIDLVYGKFHILEKNKYKKEFMKIVDGICRIVILKVQKEHNILESNRVTVCLVIKNDGTLLSEDELTTYSARKQVLSGSSKKLTVSSMLRLCRKVCQFLHRRMSDSSLKSIHWFEQQVNMLIKLEDQNLTYTRNYIKVVLACINDKVKGDVIDSLMCTYSVIGISHISQKDVLNEDNYVIELFIKSVAKALDPSFKIHHDNQPQLRYRSKRKDKRNKNRQLPNMKDYTSNIISDIKNILNFILTMSKIYNYDGGLKLCRKTWNLVIDDKQVRYTIMDLISDYTSEWIFEKRTHDLSDIAGIIHNTVEDKVLSSVPEDTEDKFCEVLMELYEKENEDQIKLKSTKKPRNKSKKRSLAEVDSTDDEEDLGSEIGGNKEKDFSTKKRKNFRKDNVSGDVRGLEDDVVIIKTVDNVKDKKINDSVTEDVSKRQKNDSVKDGECTDKCLDERGGIDNSKNGNDNVEGNPGIRKIVSSGDQSDENCPSRIDDQSESPKDGVKNMVKQSTDNVKEIERECQEKEQTTSKENDQPESSKDGVKNMVLSTDNVKEIGECQEKEQRSKENDNLMNSCNHSDKQTLVANNVSSKQFSYFVSLIGSPQRDSVPEDNARRKAGKGKQTSKDIVKNIKIPSDMEIEPEMDKDKIPDGKHLDFLAEEERKKMDDSVKTIFVKEASKLIHPQSVWQRSNMRSMTLRLWLRHMFVPSGHRCNGLCTFEFLKHIHAQLFSLAADRYFEDVTAADGGALKIPGISAVDRSIKDTFGKLYLERKRKILTERGWVMFKGFARKKTIHTASGSFKNMLSFSELERFVSKMPITDGVSGQCLWEVVRDSENIDIVNVEKNPLEGRQMTSHYALSTYLEREGGIWKEKAILEMATGLLLYILNPKAVGDNAVPRMYMPNNGGRVIRTLKNAERQPFHCDLEVEKKRRISSCPGYTVMVAGSAGFFIWIAEGSHWYLQSPNPKKKLECRKVWVFPNTIIYLRGDCSHAGAGYKESRASKDGDLRFHMVFVPTDQKLPEEIFLTSFEKEFIK